MRKTLTLISGLILTSGAAFAQTTDGGTMDHGTMTMDSGDMPMDHGDMAMDETEMPMDHSDMTMDPSMIDDGVHVKAVVNSFGDGTVNVSHDPIPAIGWPAMTMDMPMMEDAQMMGEIAEGDSVTMMLTKGEDGMYSVAALMAKE